MPFNQVDIEVDSEGDLVVASNGDLSLASEKRTLEQDVLFRLKTDHLDFSAAPFIGADLSSVVGEPNTRRTGDLIKELVHISLTQDNRVPGGVLYVEVVPVAIDAVQLIVIISDKIGTETTPSVISYTISFTPELDNEEITNITE